MAAYMIVEVQVNDPAEYEEYKKLTPGTLVPFQGKFIVRGGYTELIEGDVQPARIVVLEFPDVERAKAWWNSPVYNEAKKIRLRTATTRMILVEGV